MNCKFDIDMLQDYLEGTIEPIEKIFVEEHLKVCRNCRKELSMMKLLFWELEDVKKNEEEIPSEAEMLRDNVLDRLFDSGPEPMGVKEFISLQKTAYSGAGIFIKFLPGAKAGQKYIRQGIRKAPEAVLKLSGGVLKGGFKIMQMRLQT